LTALSVIHNSGLLRIFHNNIFLNLVLLYFKMSCVYCCCNVCIVVVVLCVLL